MHNFLIRFLIILFFLIPSIQYSQAATGTVPAVRTYNFNSNGFTQSGTDPVSICQTSYDTYMFSKYGGAYWLNVHFVWAITNATAGIGNCSSNNIVVGMAVPSIVYSCPTGTLSLYNCINATLPDPCSSKTGDTQYQGVQFETKAGSNGPICIGGCDYSEHWTGVWYQGNPDRSYVKSIDIGLGNSCTASSITGSPITSAGIKAEQNPPVSTPVSTVKSPPVVNTTNNTTTNTTTVTNNDNSTTTTTTVTNNVDGSSSSTVVNNPPPASPSSSGAANAAPSLTGKPVTTAPSFCTDNPNSLACRTQTDCEAHPNHVGCQDYNATTGTASGSDAIYTKTSNDSAISDEVNADVAIIQGSGWYQSVTQFFDVQVSGGGCGGMTESFAFGGASFTVDMDSVFCGSAAQSMYDVLRIGVLLVAAWLAFSIAFLG